MKTRLLGMSKKRIDFIWYLLFISIILFGINVLFNAWINKGARVFYLDDLEYYGAYMEQGAKSFLTNTLANKTRFVLNALLILLFKVMGSNYEVLDIALFGLNWFIAIGISLIIYSLCEKGHTFHSKILGCIGGILYIASRFAYYNMSELFGIMEGLALFLAIMILYLLIKFVIQVEEKKSYFYAASILYLLIVYIHERYFVLVGVFIIAIIFRYKKSWKKYSVTIWPLLILSVFWISRFVLLGDNIIDGTGGTSINTTFDFFRTLKFCISQVAYILGINCGPAYLNGIGFRDVPVWVNIFIAVNCIIVFCMGFMFIKILINNKMYREKYVPIVFLILTFIGCCIVASSITIRVEMRWIYVSYSAFLILFMVICSVVIKEYKIKNILWMICAIQLLSTLIFESYYRSNYKNLYYWGVKDSVHSLYESTIEKYGESFSNFTTIVIGENTLEWTEETWKKFFSPYIKTDNLKLHYTDNINEVMKVQVPLRDNTIVLIEDISNNRYIDITNFIRTH